MPDWLRDSIQGGEQHLPEQVAARVALSFILGFVVAGVYAVSLPKRRNETATLATTLVLLCVLIAVVTLVIGNSVARAFGLVGALSIVRFRTIVEDTRDTAFVIFAVVVGMSAGAGYALLAAATIPAVLVAALIMREFHRSNDVNGGLVGVLNVRVGIGANPDAMLGPVFAKYLTSHRLTGAATARQGAAIEAVYKVELRRAADTVALVAELNRVEGVQNVELKADEPRR